MFFTTMLHLCLAAAAVIAGADPLIVPTDRGAVQGSLVAGGRVRAFKGIPFAAPPVGNLRWQAPHPRHVYHLCVARVPDRDAFRERLPVQSAVHYPRPLTAQPAYQRFARVPCPEAEAWAAECVSLPCFPELTDDEIDVVCRAL